MMGAFYSSRTPIFILAIFIFMNIFCPPFAHACECAAMSETESRQLIERAVLIFEGTVMSLEEREQPEENFSYDMAMPVSENPLYAKANLKIGTVYKGKPEGERVEAYIDTLTSCGAPYQQGDGGTFMLLPRDGVLVQADACTMPLPQDWKDVLTGRYRAP